MRTIFGVGVGLLIITVVIPLLFSLFGITGLKMPFMLYMTLNDSVGVLFRKISFFIPLNYLLMCLFIVFLAKHIHTLLNIINYIIDRVTGN